VREGEDPIGGLATGLGGRRRRVDRPQPRANDATENGFPTVFGFPKQRKIHPFVSNNLWVLIFSRFRLVNWGKILGYSRVISWNPIYGFLL
jgi:hypothetical protein